MNEQEIARAIAVLEQGIEKAYRQYAREVSGGYSYAADATMRGIKRADKELTELRARLTKHFYAEESAKYGVGIHATSEKISGDISVPTETTTKVRIEPWWKRMFGF